MQHNFFHTSLARLIAILLSSLMPVLAGCKDTSSSPSGFSQLQSMASDCGHVERDTAIASDESATSRGATSLPERQSVIREAITRTAVCSGTFELRIFAGSSVGLVVITRSLSTSGATETARLRKVSKLVDQVMADIDQTLPAVRAALPGGATDIVGQYQTAAEFFAQASVTDPKATRSLTILTDGIQTAAPSLADQSLTTSVATKLAESVTTEQVGNVDVRVLGIGRVNGDEQLPTDYVDALKAFHRKVCERSGAQSCLIATDPTDAGGA